MKKLSTLILMLIFTTMLFYSAQSAIPEKISYQGLATNSSNEPLTGTHSLTVKLYDISNNQIWT
jgi:hypothetical protein